jgi:glycosyltransferase involved in cell wall biosynthesis
MITTFFPPYHFGGDANYVKQLCDVLVKRGHEVDVIHDIDAFTTLSPRADPPPIALKEGVNVFGMQSRWGTLSCLATQQLARPVFHGARIRKILEDRKPDIIHYHNVSLIGGAGILSYGKGIKIYTAHEHWLVCPTHVLWRNNREVCDKKKCLRCVLNYRRPPQLWRRTSYLRRHAASVDQFCSPSEFSAGKHKEFGFHRSMKVLPSFLPDADEYSGGHGASDDKHQPYFLFVGRLEKIKGVQDVIPLFRKYAKAQLWIVGSGDYEQELRRVAGGSDNIRFLGHKQPEQLRALYAGAVAVMMPSICYEVFPLVALEAFRENVPVIARSLGPYPEIIRKSGGGLLFSTKEELQGAVQRMVEDADGHREMASAAKAAYDRLWSERAAMKEYFQLINEIAHRHNNSRVIDILGRCDDSGCFSSEAVALP